MTELQIHRFCLGDNENMTLRGRLALRTGPGKGPAPTITWGAEDADTWETRPCPPHSPTPGNALSPRDGRPRGHGVMSVAPSKRDREWACRPPGGRRAVRRHLGADVRRTEHNTEREVTSLSTPAQLERERTARRGPGVRPRPVIKQLPYQTWTLYSYRGRGGLMEEQWA